MKTTKAHGTRIIGILAAAAAAMTYGADDGSYRVNERSWKVAQAAPQAGAQPPAGVAELAKRVAELEAAVDALKAPRRFVVMALFKYADDAPKQLTDLPAGQTSGLPTGSYDWPCDGCAKTGNMRWHAKDDPARNGTAPANWGWSHVGGKSFASAYEANTWLNDTEEGRFVRKNAEAVMTFTTTDYSPVASGSIAIQRSPRIR